MNRTLILSIIASFAFACGSVDSGDSGGDTQSNNDDSTGAGTFGPGTLGPGSGTGMDDANASSGGPNPGDSTGATFLQMPDGGGVAIECDVWMQDCPDGEKCMPWANDGGSSWNATRCSPIADNPGQVGDECTVEGSGVSGVDDCEISSMCYYVDPETNMGTCVGFCAGSPEAPICDPGFLCSIVNNGVLILCREECDPLLQDCQGGSACLQATGSEGFVCIIDASGEGGAPGDPCEFLNACDPGMFCAAAEAVPGCASSNGCCSEFCDLTDPDPNGMCTQMGQECVSWFEEGSAPPDYAHVGACVIPA